MNKEKQVGDRTFGLSVAATTSALAVFLVLAMWFLVRMI